MQTVACKWCGKPTPMLNTRCCDSCWELSTRIEGNPDLATLMLAAIRLRGDAKRPTYKCAAKGCNYPVAGPDMLCGECACEDDCAP